MYRPAEKAVCKKCDQEKAASQFHKDPRNRTGLFPWCKECRKKYQQGRRPRDNALARARYQRLRIECLIAYSGDPPRCACCDENHLEFLAIDHVAGNGNQERKELGIAAGKAWYRHLRESGFPPGYRVLCHNCNCAHGFYGYCPHERE